VVDGGGGGGGGLLLSCVARSVWNAARSHRVPRGGLRRCQRSFHPAADCLTSAPLTKLSLAQQWREEDEPLEEAPFGSFLVEPALARPEKCYHEVSANRPALENRRLEAFCRYIPKGITCASEGAISRGAGNTGPFANVVLPLFECSLARQFVLRTPRHAQPWREVEAHGRNGRGEGTRQGLKPVHWRELDGSRWSRREMHKVRAGGVRIKASAPLFSSAVLNLLPSEGRKVLGNRRCFRPRILQTLLSSELAGADRARCSACTRELATIERYATRARSRLKSATSHIRAYQLAYASDGV
jgi:hypothetical protein